MATKSKQVIIGLVGMPASGKSSVAEYITKRYNAVHIKTHDFIWNFLKARGVKPDKETSMMAALYIWAEYGDIPLAGWVVRQARASKSKIVVIDSLRTTEEARTFKSRFKDKFHIVAVLASPQIRFKRQASRARFGPLTKLEFRMRDREELRLGVGDLIASSEHYIDANPGIEKIKPNIDLLIKTLKVGRI